MLLNCGVGEDSWESLGLQGGPTHPSWDQSWVFIGSTNVKAETPILWPLYAKNWLIGKDSDAGRDWGQEKKSTKEHEMAGWHLQLNGHEFGWTPGVGDGQGGLVCCDSWSCKESDTTARLSWTEQIKKKKILSSRHCVSFQHSKNKGWSSILKKLMFNARDRK